MTQSYTFGTRTKTFDVGDRVSIEVAPGNWKSGVVQSLSRLHLIVMVGEKPNGTDYVIEMTATKARNHICFNNIRKE